MISIFCLWNTFYRLFPSSLLAIVSAASSLSLLPIDSQSPVHSSSLDSRPKLVVPTSTSAVPRPFPSTAVTISKEALRQKLLQTEALPFTQRKASLCPFTISFFFSFQNFSWTFIFIFIFRLSYFPFSVFFFPHLFSHLSMSYLINLLGISLRTGFYFSFPNFTSFSFLP